MQGRKSTKLIIIGSVISVFSIASIVQHREIKHLKCECESYKHNTEVLIGNVEQFYKVKDSLNAARIENLELSLKEYQRYRSEDAELIKSLQEKNRNLSSVNKTQLETIIELRSIPRDTVIIRDSVKIKALKVHCGDIWYDFDGVVTQESFTGTLQNRDSLLVAETVKYKRFLGFLWKTRDVKNRQIDVVSKNPHTDIKGVEYITILKK